MVLQFASGQDFGQKCGLAEPQCPLQTVFPGGANPLSPMSHIQPVPILQLRIRKDPLRTFMLVSRYRFLLENGILQQASQSLLQPNETLQ